LTAFKCDEFGQFEPRSQFPFNPHPPAPSPEYQGRGGGCIRNWGRMLQTGGHAGAPTWSLCDVVRAPLVLPYDLHSQERAK
jgi:hypothetical protein